MSSVTCSEGQWPASDAPHRITTAAQAAALAECLLSDERRRPFVVITTHPGYDRPFIDPAGVSDEVSGLVPVVELDAAAAEWLTAGIGDPLAAVSHGAARVYPIGRRWRSDPEAGMHLCLSPQQGPAAQAALIADALAAAQVAGLLTGADPGADSPQVEAHVAGFSSDYHVMLRCTDGRRAVLHTGRLRLDVPPPRLVRRGQALRGVMVGRGPFWQFLPDLPRWDIAAVVRQAYPSGALVPAMVSTVQPSRAEVLLHPDFAVELTGEEDDLTRLMAPGDVVAVEVGWSGTACSVVLGDESRAALAMPVLPGGPPWLLLDRPAPTDPPPPGSLAPVGSDMAAVTMQRIARRAAALEAEVAILRRQAAAARTHRRAALIEAREQALPEVFVDAEQQLRWEIGVTYLAHVAESDRPAHPLREFALGPAFPTRLDLLQGTARTTVLRTIVDLVTGRLPPVPTGSSSDGAGDEWQVPVPRRTGPPATLSGRRLPDGRIELRRI